MLQPLKGKKKKKEKRKGYAAGKQACMKVWIASGSFEARYLRTGPLHCAYCDDHYRAQCGTL